MNQLRDARGVSLVELMVATLIFSVVAAFGMRFLVLQHGWAVYQEDVAEAQQQARAALDLMGRELSIVGFGVPEGDAKILMATEKEVEFLTNMDKEITHLTAEAREGQKQLSVNGEEFEQGNDFEENKTVSICTPDHCERHSLVEDGGENSLELAEGLNEAFPIGSTIQVLNRIRYALKPMDSTQFKLVRTVDGGANPVAEGLASMRLEYLDGAGRPATAFTDIHRIWIQLTARMPRTPEKVRSLVSELYLRNGDGSP